MTYEEAKEILRVAAAEAEWNYPLDYTEAFKKAEEALDKQIPQKPINLSNARYDAYCAIFRCPRCKGRLKMKSKGAYCDKCGGAIDWSDGNEN
jgi:hypothetical protein